ncbi:MAG: macro domain-containing protein [Spirulina sp.]
MQINVRVLVHPNELKLILVDPNEELCQEWRQKFAEIDAISVINGYFEDLDRYDCMVSPANSFGLMDGGVDLAIVRYFGLDLMDRVQDYILHEFRGEQPVGTSFIIETKHPKHPFLAHTPTMRVPMTIAQTDNVYRAMQAMLLAVWHHNQKEVETIRIIACPGLGTATGQMPSHRAAKQMALAYKNFLNPPQTIDWPYAITRQNAIGFGGDR